MSSRHARRRKSWHRQGCFLWSIRQKSDSSMIPETTMWECECFSSTFRIPLNKKNVRKLLENHPNTDETNDDTLNQPTTRGHSYRETILPHSRNYVEPVHRNCQSITAPHLGRPAEALSVPDHISALHRLDNRTTITTAVWCFPFRFCFSDSLCLLDLDRCLPIQRMT